MLAPVVRARKGEFVSLFAELQAKGFARARVDGAVVSLTEPPMLEKQVKHTIDVVVDRLVAKGGDRSAKQRLTDSVETALGLAGGIVVIDQSELLPAILAALSAPPPPAKRADRKLVETIAADLRDLAAARHLLI